MPQSDITTGSTYAFEPATDTDMKVFAGHRVTVISQRGESEYDSAELGALYLATFPDGGHRLVYAEELRDPSEVEEPWHSLEEVVAAAEGAACPTCLLAQEEPDEPIQPGDHYTVDPTSPSRCPSCGLVPGRDSEGARRVAAVSAGSPDLGYGTNATACAHGVLLGEPCDQCNPPAETRVHNHAPWRPMCAERRLSDGQLRGACLNDDGTDVATTSTDRTGSSTEFEAGRAAERERIIAQLRFLSRARREYFRGEEPEHSGELDAMQTSDLLVWSESRTADQLAAVLAGVNDAKGWLPSWRWSEWISLTGDTPSSPDGADG